MVKTGKAIERRCSRFYAILITQGRKNGIVHICWRLRN